MRLDPGASGRGLALSVQPAWGRTASGVRRLWENGIPAGASPDNRARLDAEIGYGLGVVTPYAGLGLAGEGARSWRMGARWRVAAYGRVSLEGAWYEAANDDGPEQSLRLRGALRW